MLIGLNGLMQDVERIVAESMARQTYLLAKKRRHYTCIFLIISIYFIFSYC
jgi:hypothetical protein